MAKLLLLVAGPNGCGKTSLYETLRTRKNMLPFLNADLIASAANGTPGTHGEVEAGKIMLKELTAALSEGRSIAIETTMSGKIWTHYIQTARKFGYTISAIFVSLDTVEKSLQRIAVRVKKGGHAIPAETVRRRWQRCHNNFLHRYRVLCDNWFIFDNSGLGAILVAQKISSRETTYHPAILSRMEEYAKA